MELSRFWKLRNLFFAIKKKLGLSADGAWAPYRVPALLASSAGPSEPYAVWLRRNMPRAADILRMREVSETLSLRPRISVVLAAYETPEPFLREAIESVRGRAIRTGNCASPTTPRKIAREKVLQEYAALDAHQSGLS